MVEKTTDFPTNGALNASQGQGPLSLAALANNVDAEGEDGTEADASTSTTTTTSFTTSCSDSTSTTTQTHETKDGDDKAKDKKKKGQGESCQCTDAGENNPSLIVLSDTNKRIVQTNIRHFQVLLWILLFSNFPVLISYIAILKSIYLWSDTSGMVFSISKIQTFLVVASILSLLITGVFMIATFLKVVRIRSVVVVHIYRVACILLVLHWIFMSICSLVQLTSATKHLGKEMFQTLDKSLNDQDMEIMIASTQMKRKCCGVNGYTDWVPDGNENDDTFASSADFFSRFNGWSMFDGFPFYPASCCVDVDHVQPIGNSSGEYPLPVCYSGKVWSQGCLEAEKFWIAWYLGWYMGILLISFAMNVLLFFQERRLHQYCKRYRPKWFLPTKKKPKFDFGIPPDGSKRCKKRRMTKEYQV